MDGEKLGIYGDELWRLVGDPEKIRDPDDTDPFSYALVVVNPDLDRFGYAWGMAHNPRGEVNVYPLTMDFLDDIEKTFSEEPNELLGVSSLTIVQPDLQLRYGRGPLTSLMTHFLYPWIAEADLERLGLARKLRILETAPPPGGWIHPERQSKEAEESLWSIPDVLWVEGKLFSKLMKQGYENETAQAEKRLTETIGKFANRKKTQKRVRNRESRVPDANKWKVDQLS
jgi:hypothetical protein